MAGPGAALACFWLSSYILLSVGYCSLLFSSESGEGGRGRGSSHGKAAGGSGFWGGCSMLLLFPFAAKGAFIEVTHVSACRKGGKKQG